MEKHHRDRAPGGLCRHQRDQGGGRKEAGEPILGGPPDQGARQEVLKGLLGRHEAQAKLRHGHARKPKDCVARRAKHGDGPQVEALRLGHNLGQFQGEQEAEEDYRVDPRLRESRLLWASSRNLEGPLFCPALYIY